MAPYTETLQKLSHLPDGRLRLGFFYHRRADWLSFFDQLDLAMLSEPGSGRDQVTHDHVFLETAQFIDLAQCGRFGENAGRILERCGRDKAVGFQRGLRDAEKHGNGLRWFSTLFDDLLVFFLEVEFVHLIAPEQRRIARVGNFHFAQHLPHDDFDVLVVDLYALQAIDLLHFVDQMLLQFLWTADFQNLVRHDWALSELLAFLHEIAFENDDVLGERDQMLFLGSCLGVFRSQTSLPADSSTHLNNSVNLSKLSRIFRPTGFE